MGLLVYDMLVNVNGIYYVHVCEQARWARSAGNSAIENICIIIIIINWRSVMRTGCYFVWPVPPPHKKKKKKERKKENKSNRERETDTDRQRDRQTDREGERECVCVCVCVVDREVNRVLANTALVVVFKQPCIWPVTCNCPTGFREPLSPPYGCQAGLKNV